MPAVLLLHGAGGRGTDMQSLWKNFAAKRGIVLVSPDLPRDAAFEPIAPRMFVALMDAAAAAAPIDPRRRYVFGYSMGGYLAYDAAMFDSQYFAAVGVFAHFIAPEYEGILNEAKRKTPIAIYIGTADPLIPLRSVRKTRDMLNAGGFPLLYQELPGQDHNYAEAAEQVNASTWQFFEKQRLP